MRDWFENKLCTKVEVDSKNIYIYQKIQAIVRVFFFLENREMKKKKKKSMPTKKEKILTARTEV